MQEELARPGQVNARSKHGGDDGSVAVRDFDVGAAVVRGAQNPQDRLQFCCIYTAVAGSLQSRFPGDAPWQKLKSAHGAADGVIVVTIFVAVVVRRVLGTPVVDAVVFLVDLVTVGGLLVVRNVVNVFFVVVEDCGGRGEVASGCQHLYLEHFPPTQLPEQLDVNDGRVNGCRCLRRCDVALYKDECWSSAAWVLWRVLISCRYSPLLVFAADFIG